MRIEYRTPSTKDMGTTVIVGRSGFGETARENALWEYNSMRRHDDLPPVKGFPQGTVSKRIPTA